MLSTAAFNALLKILEEPPAHLMFILATTELHKVPGHHQVPVPAVLLQAHPARGDRPAAGLCGPGGGHRPHRRRAPPCWPDWPTAACGTPCPCWTSASGRRATVDEEEVLWTRWAWRAIWRPPPSWTRSPGGTPPPPWRPWPACTPRGRTWAAVLGELSALARDLLLRKTAPQGGASLLTGGYDETTMRALAEQFTAQRLLQMLSRAPECHWPTCPAAATAARTPSCASSACATRAWTSP